MSKYSFSISQIGVVAVKKVTDAGNHRFTVTPDDDISELPDEVQDYCEENWTPKLRETYAKHLVETRPSPLGLADINIQVNDAIESSLMDLVGYPSQSEIASWPNKIEAANRVKSGASQSELLLSPTMQKYGVDIGAAADIVHLRVRLYEFAKAGFEVLQHKIVVALSDVAPEEYDQLVGSMLGEINEQHMDFLLIIEAAKLGDLGPLEDAEQNMLDAHFSE